MRSDSQPNAFLATAVALAAGATLLFTGGRQQREAQRARRPGTPASDTPAPGAPAPADDRGRLAAHPAQIPARGWWDILKRSVAQISEDRVLTEAAGITFYSLLALFPAIGAMISIYGLFADPAAISEHLQAVSVIVPQGGMQIIDEQVKRIVSKGGTSLGIGAVIGLVTSLWSANQAMKALVDALNVVYSEKERRGFLLRNAVTLAFTLGGILFILLAMASVVVLPVAMHFLGIEGTLGTLLGLGRWPVLLAAIGLFLAFVYRFGPSRDRAQWRWVSWGSAAAAIGFVAVSVGFSYYVSNFGSYNETYGSLGAVIGFMTWVWLSSTVVLVGAELDAEMEHQTARDTTSGPERPIGARGAKMADTVA